MLGFKDGKYQEVDTSGSWLLAILLATLVVLPIWLLWKIIQVIFFNNKNKNK